MTEMMERGRVYFEWYKAAFPGREHRRFHQLTEAARRSWCHQADLRAVREEIKRGQGLVRDFRPYPALHATCVEVLGRWRGALLFLKAANPLHYDGIDRAPVIPVCDRGPCRCGSPLDPAGCGA